MRRISTALGLIATLVLAACFGGGSASGGGGGSTTDCPKAECQERARSGIATADIGQCGAAFEGCAGYTSSGMFAVCGSCKSKGSLCVWCGDSLDTSVPRPPKADPPPAWPPGAEPAKPVPSKPEPRQPATENGAYCAPCYEEHHGVLTKSIGNCGSCGGQTNSGMLSVCFGCAKEQSVCALCSHPIAR